MLYLGKLLHIVKSLCSCTICPGGHMISTLRRWQSMCTIGLYKTSSKKCLTIASPSIIG